MTTQSAPLHGSLGIGAEHDRRAGGLDEVPHHLFRRKLRRRRDIELELETLGGMRPGRQHVVVVAGPGHRPALDRAAMLFVGHEVGHHLARVRAPCQAVDDGHRRIFRQLQQGLVIEDADHDGVDIARQHARRVGDGLAAAELHLGAGQHDRARRRAGAWRRRTRRGCAVEGRSKIIASVLPSSGFTGWCAFCFAFMAEEAASMLLSSDNGSSLISRKCFGDLLISSPPAWSDWTRSRRRRARAARRCPRFRLR